MPQVIYAHRGASGYAPENTLEAFELAAKQNAFGVELDVHICKSGELVVAHDETIDRVSNGSGRIADMTWKELRSYNFNKMHPEYEKGTLLTLEEVYELLYPTGLYVNVEMKNSVIDYANLEARCAEAAAKTGMTNRVMYSSFNHYSLLRMKAIDKNAPCGLLYHATLYEPWNYARTLQVDALHPHQSELRVPGEVEAAHRLGIEVNPWTVNTEADLRYAINIGADRIITNYPDVALKLLKEIKG